MAAASKSSIFLLFAVFVAVSLSNVEVGMAARQLLQLPDLPAVGGLPVTVPTLPVVPKLPVPAGVVPTIPAVPKVGLPPVGGGVAGVPVAIPNIPGVTPSVGN
ncbi:unnamed protein product [Linum tenue]|uniref:Uncharacterized protein n=2 Tax=Linum tenue TaxID=586396 RepID=A0AAV0JTQ2_9ROSI|nr:unnamed protein product [Linum tenue]